MTIVLDEKAKRFGVRLPLSVIAWIEAEAARHSISASCFVRSVIVAAMNGAQEQPAQKAEKQ